MTTLSNHYLLTCHVIYYASESTTTLGERKSIDFKYCESQQQQQQQQQQQPQQQQQQQQQPQPADDDDHKRYHVLQTQIRNQHIEVCPPHCSNLNQ